MKRTDLERVERELKRREKLLKIRERRTPSVDAKTVKGYTDALFERLLHDDQAIYNIEDNEEILELMLEMREDLAAKQWEVVIRKAVRQTAVAEQEEAVVLLKEMVED